MEKLCHTNLLTTPTKSFLKSLYAERTGALIGCRNTGAMVQDLKSTHTQTQIAGKLGKQIAVVNRMCKSGYEPHKTKARYFSDFMREADWFIKL